MALGITARREAARHEILRACWELAAEHGLAGFTLRQVAAAIGIRAPSLYSYFAAKNDMYDAMFRQGAEAFAAAMAVVPAYSAPRKRFRAAARAFLEFCVADSVRYQLLFQRTLPGFTPTADAYAPAVAAYQHMAEAFAEVGVTRPRDLDLWTALLTGMASQQLANDPGGARWTHLAGDAADMFADHVLGGSR